MASTSTSNAPSTRSTAADSPEPPLPSPETGPKASEGGADGRDALLDNAKFLLIVLVFVGHAISPATDTRLADAVYFWIYLFHMPAFALICGYLSKSFDGSARRVDKLLTTVAAPYLIFWGVYALQSLSVGRNLPSSPLEPLWLTWFLAALFVWRLSVPVWHRVRMPVAVAVVISLAAGMATTGDALGISRILSLLPFFVLGLYLERRHFEALRLRRVRLCAIAVVLATAALTYIYFERLSLEWVFWRESLSDRDLELLPIGLPGRVLFLVLALTLTAAFLSLTPARRTWFTHLGAFTMYVYLLHGLPIRIADGFGWYEVVNGYTGLAVNAALAVALTFLLCSPWVRAATCRLVEPKVDWILRRQPETPRAPRTPERA